MLSHKIKSPKLWQNKGAKLRSAWRSFFKLLQKIFKPSSASKLKSFLKILIVSGVFFTLIGSIVGIGAIAYYSKDLPDPNKLIDRQVVQSTKIFDRTGNHLLYEISDEVKRTIVKLNDIPDYAKNAAIALEDKNFYKHHGLSLRRIILAVIKKVFTGNGPGASTLTQQLVKNAILSPERTISRKLKEWVLTIQIERKFSKDQILQLYFNEIPYGSTAYGIESAASLYFGKSAKDLTLGESAILAAIIKKPTYYSPFGSHRDELIKRQKLVLDLMVDQGYLKKEEAEAAKKEEIKFKSKKEAIEAPHFVFYVRELLTNNYGEKIVEQGGLKVYTTLDYDLQKIAETAVKEGVEKIAKFEANNSSLVAVDPKKGEILAMVGSKDYFDTENDGNVNVALSLRQPGSSFKPIVYATAFMKGYTPETVLYDVVTTFKTEIKDYTPHNYDGKERGPVTIRQALAGSLNIPAVKTIYLTGINRVLDLANDLGYTSLEDRSRFGLSLVLGGGEVKLMEHVMAFSAFANDGVKISSPISILKVEDKNGRPLEEAVRKEKKVLPKEIARLINSILSDNNARAFVFGAKNSLVLKDRPAAAKTGTTNDYRDAWTIGYTPQLVAGVWVGNNDNSKMKKGADGSLVAAPIWNKFMSEALKDKEVENFPAPPPNRSQKPVLRGEKIGEKTVKIDKASGLLATEFTPASFIEERTYVEHHNILHYIYKDNPDGPVPQSPEDADIQYRNWEEAIERWANEKNKDKEVVAAQPPIDYDNVHVPENRPNLSILSPTNNQMLNDNNLSVTVSASALRGLSRVEYLVDDLTVTVVRGFPFHLNSYSMVNIDNGFHELKVRAYDDIDNSTEAKINFNLLAEKPAVLVSWLGPLNDSSFPLSAFPLSLNVYINKPEKVQQVSFYHTDLAGQRTLINTVPGPIEETVFTKWNSINTPGRYRLLAEVLTTEGQTLSSQEIFVTVRN